MIVHVCCSVDSHYFLQNLTKEYPNEKITAFFYDPNIHPYLEYKLRLLDAQHSCDILGIELIEGDYNYEQWIKNVKGYENEPEKGDRCTICFDDRLEQTCKQAIKNGNKKFTTTLLMSPLKSQEKLIKIGANLEKLYDLEFVYRDYKKGSGTQFQGQTVKENNLYRQDYCGCLYGLIPQREQQNSLCDELFSPITNQIMPNSIEYRMQLYKKRNAKYNENKDASTTKIIKQEFLNYRLLGGKTGTKQQTFDSYYLCYSSLKNKKSTGKIEQIINGIGYFNKHAIKIIDIDKFNALCGKNYENVQQISKNPLTFEEEFQVRLQVTNNNIFDLSLIIVLDKLVDEKLIITCDSEVFQDTKEQIL